MDTTLSESERLVQSQIEDLLSREVSTELVQSVEDSGKFPQGLWKTLADSGWFGIGTKSEGTGITEWMLVLEQMGRVACPGPVVEQLTAAVYLDAIGAPADLRGDVASGRRIVTAAMVDKPDDAVKAQSAEGSSATLNGSKVGVAYVAESELAIVSSGGEKATGYYLANLNDKDVSVRPIKTVSRDLRGLVEFDSVSAAYLGGQESDPRRDFLQMYKLAQTAYAVGMIGRMRDISVAYVSDRVQFGRPLGSLQAVQHRCADMAVACVGAQSLLYYTAWRLAKDLRMERSLLMCHAFIKDAVGEVIRHAHQVHGAMGFTMEYPLQLFSRRARALQLAFGTAAQHREEIAKLDDEGDPFFIELLGKDALAVGAE